MEELKAILITHAKRYPLMQPTDAVKLIYQNEFGGGHLIRDEEICLNYLRQEYTSVEKNPNMRRLTVSIACSIMSTDDRPASIFL